MSYYRKAFWKYIKQMGRVQWQRGKGRFLIGLLFIVILGVSYWTLEPDSASKSTTTIVTNDEVYQCKIKRVVDGDTVIANCPPNNREQLRIRVWGIDAPEMKQENWGEASKSYLIMLLSQADHDIIEIKVRDIDHYGRYVGQLFLNNLDLGLELVKNGEAVVYKQYNNEANYLQAQESAQKQKLGIWKKEGAQQDPATWRKLNPR
ncbi:hypothetical protein DC083_01725 [Ignatzschineria ureiclastica]|uniref:TNase-like domain-containing protein n=1 Tax=Ignatzschineria ureiclastica TaxID=472582 RepID=A0A2U2AGY3_9GAMM|nr:thermonuclease family protein [Ignatzschineria ureiclastica]PWD81924.1 hypothetical protein DC083_01725 [Ignatzschineria ureiclastica]GGZ91446.1 hypothetical protein GCM10007162_03310 [Ignatzschineria ureiclastica]